MRTLGIELTLIDRMILQSYCGIIDGLADYLGAGYEIVLHSLENLDQSVIYIVHGEYTGRKVGAPITDKALQMLDVIEQDNRSEVTYFSRNKKGEPLKSATLAIRGENNRIIGLLCMNFYLNTPFADIISSFMIPDTLANSVKSDENFAENVDDLIVASLSSVSDMVHNDTSISPSNKNKVIIKILNDRGIFNIKDSVIKVAGLMGISKNTVYMHLRNIQEK